MSGGRPWTDQEVVELVRRYPHERTQDIAKDLGRSLPGVYVKSSQLGLRKTAAFLAGPDSGRILPDSDDRRPVGFSSRFRRNTTPWNKGISYDAGGRSVETRFQAGNRPHNTVPIGSYRVASRYLQRKIRDTGYHVHDWEFVHRRLWEDAHGSIPEGHVVVFRGSRTTVLEEITLDRLELISRRDLMRRNTIHRYPPELKDAMRTLGRLKNTIKKDDAR